MRKWIQTFTVTWRFKTVLFMPPFWCSLRSDSNASLRQFFSSSRESSAELSFPSPNISWLKSGRYATGLQNLSDIRVCSLNIETMNERGVIQRPPWLSKCDLSPWNMGPIGISSLPWSMWCRTAGAQASPVWISPKWVDSLFSKPVKISNSFITVCLGSTNFFFYFLFFMPDLACYQKVWVRAFYCQTMSL